MACKDCEDRHKDDAEYWRERAEKAERKQEKAGHLWLLGLIAVYVWIFRAELAAFLSRGLPAVADG